MEPSKELSKYEVQAREVAEKIGIEVIAAFQGDQCPEWGGGERQKTRHACTECGQIHGDKFRITIKRMATGKSVSFDYWASWASCNKMAGEIQRHVTPSLEAKKYGLAWWDVRDEDPNKVFHVKHRPSYYDVLCCVGSDVNGSTDPDEIFAELGPMTPSRAEAIAAATRKLQAFFTEAERALLAEVQ